jgi:hypothetical protein
MKLVTRRVTLALTYLEIARPGHVGIRSIFAIHVLPLGSRRRQVLTGGSLPILHLLEGWGWMRWLTGR